MSLSLNIVVYACIFVQGKNFRWLRSPEWAPSYTSGPPVLWYHGECQCWLERRELGFKLSVSPCQVHISSRREAARKSISSPSSTNFPPVSFVPPLALIVSSPVAPEQVPFGPLAFMPGKLVHTNEVTALLGDNWFARCSAKQAQKLVAHRMKCKVTPALQYTFTSDRGCYGIKFIHIKKKSKMNKLPPAAHSYLPSEYWES